MKLSVLKKRLEAISIEKEIVKAIALHKKRMADLNRQQLAKGIKTDGGNIGKYSSRYAARRRKLGKQTGYVDLKVTGALYKEIDVFVTNKQTVFFSRATYAQYMVNRYAKTSKAHIFGLTDANFAEIKNLVSNSINNNIRSGLFKL